MARARISLAEIDKALHQELTQRLGYDAKDHMMRVNYISTGGEPNWNANFAAESPAPLTVLNAFIEALAHVKTIYPRIGRISSPVAVRVRPMPTDIARYSIELFKQSGEGIEQ